MSNFTNLGSRICSLFNDNSIFEDPYEVVSGMQRGNWWHEDEPLPTAKFPRGQVQFVSDPMSDKSFSKDFTYQQENEFNIIIYTKHNFKYKNMKNQTLVLSLLGSAFDILKQNTDKLGVHSFESDGKDVVPSSVKGVDMWIGIMPVRFKERKW